MKKAIVCFLVAVLALTCFAACGKKTDTEAESTPKGIPGMYVISRIEHLPDGTDRGGTTGARIELREDGTVRATSYGEVRTGTWTRDGDTVTVTVDKETLAFTYDGSVLSQEADGVTIRLDRDEAASGADANAPEAVGTYTVKSLGEQSAEDLVCEAAKLGAGSSVEDALAALGIASVEDYMKLELKADGTMTATRIHETQTAIWTQDGDLITITDAKGEHVTFTLSGNMLTGTVGQSPVVFVKQ